MATNSSTGKMAASRARRAVWLAALLAVWPRAAHGFRAPSHAPCAGVRMAMHSEEARSLGRREAVAASLRYAAAVAVAGRPLQAGAAAAQETVPTFGNVAPVPHQAGQVPGLFQSAKGYGKGSYSFLFKRATR